MPVTAIRIYPVELGWAVVYGFLVTIGFALGPLGRARQLPATSLFADRAVHAPVQPPLVYRAAQGMALAVLAALAIHLAGDRKLSLFYVGAVVAAFIVLRLVAIGIMLAARRVNGLRGTTLRLAVRNIHRPGALTPSVVLSLGLGLTLLVSLALIDTNLRDQLSGTITEKAPDFFFVDVQDKERDAFVQAPPAERSGRDRRDGADAAGPHRDSGRNAGGEISPARRRRAGCSAATAASPTPTRVPENSTLVAGAWWPAGYEGEPLVSLEKETADSARPHARRIRSA